MLGISGKKEDFFHLLGTIDKRAWEKLDYPELVKFLQISATYLNPKENIPEVIKAIVVYLDQNLSMATQRLFDDELRSLENSLIALDLS